MRVVFMGTPDFAVPVLDALLSSEEVVGVFTQPDRPAGRGKKLTPPPVKRRAEEAGVPVYQPERMREEGAMDELETLRPELIVVVAYGQILPKRVLDLPKHGCINVHASLLPALRGAAPINYAILEGHERAGVTTMYMDEGLDTGDMLVKRDMAIPPRMTAGELHDALMPLGVEALLETIERIKDGTLVRTPQDDDASTYAPMMNRAMAQIDFRAPAEVIDRKVRGLYPWPMAWAERDGVRVKIHRAEPVSVDHGAVPGTILSIGEEGIRVACGEGALEITVVQFPGSRAMPVADYLRGHDVDPQISFS